MTDLSPGLNTTAINGAPAAAPPQYKYFFSFRIVAAEGTKISGSQAGMPEDIDGMPEYKESLAALASKRVTLSYGPSTAADEAHINNLASQDPPPSTLSAYLLKVKPQLLVDGQLVKQGSGVSLGAKQKAIAKILYPSLSTMSDFRFVKELDAGSYYAIGVLNGVPTKQFLEGKQALLEDVKSRLESASGAVKDESLGEMLHTTVTGYIAQTEVEARLSATSSRVFYHGLPSISFTHTYLVRNNLFGIVKSVSMSDLIMDVQARNVMLALDGDREKTKLYAQQNGVMGSYYEGHIWKQMFPDDPGINPVSTVHLFAQAAIQGQPFVVIDRSNMNEALANITGLGDDTRADIVNSVLAGNTVTTHTMPINMGDWRGFGYVVFNPQTFSSVYMIDGGPRGGATGCDGGLIAIIISAVALIVSIVALVASSPLLGLLGVLAVVVYVLSLVNLFFSVKDEKDIDDREISILIFIQLMSFMIPCLLSLTTHCILFPYVCMAYFIALAIVLLFVSIYYYNYSKTHLSYDTRIYKLALLRKSESYSF